MVNDHEKLRIKQEIKLYLRKITIGKQMVDKIGILVN